MQNDPSEAGFDRSDATALLLCGTSATRVVDWEFVFTNDGPASSSQASMAGPVSQRTRNRNDAEAG